MTLSWISRRNGDSVEPRSDSKRRIRKISPTQLEIVVTVHDPTRELGKAGTAGAIS